MSTSPFTSFINSPHKHHLRRETGVAFESSSIVREGYGLLTSTRSDAIHNDETGERSQGASDNRIARYLRTSDDLP